MPQPTPAHRFPAVRVAAAVLLLLLAHLAIGALDRALAESIREAPVALVRFFAVATEMGDSKWILWASGLAAIGLGTAGRLAPGRRARAMLWWAAGACLFVFAAVALSGIAANIVKVLVGRGRPKTLELEDFLGLSPFNLDADYHSFPSGHANTAIALALALGFLMPRLRAALLALFAVVAFSRVVVSAHFLTDVLGGAALAVVTTYWLRGFCAARGWVFEAVGGEGRIRPRRVGRDLPRRLAAAVYAGLGGRRTRRAVESRRVV